jgi:copper chaperone CopZ
MSYNIAHYSSILERFPMKIRSILFTFTTVLLLAGCGDPDARSKEKKANPTFMFWCFRKEIVSADYLVPAMRTTEAANYIQSRLKAVPGYESSSYDLSSHTITVDYKSSQVRKMNFEEAIAQSGFAVNHRPAYPKAKLPEGIK